MSTEAFPRQSQDIVPNIEVPIITVPTDIGDRVVSQYTVQQLAAEVARLRVENKRLDTDLVEVCQALYDEAESRSWCDEYDEFVEKVNQRTSSKPLKIRYVDQSFVVTIDLTVARSSDVITDVAIKNTIESVLAEHLDGVEDVIVSVGKAQ